VTDQDRIAELEVLIRHHRELYYNREPEITDAEFDALVDELETLSPDSATLAEVGAPVVQTAGLPTKEHRIPMGSLDKVTPDRLEHWAEKTGQSYLIQEKYDGISIELEYEGGELVDAITRGDGFTGEVVTHNAVCFRNAEKRLSKPFTGSVRGEVILRLSEFEKHFASRDFANPRNTVSGTVRKKHGDRSLNKHFEVFFYDVLSVDREFDTEREKMRFLEEELELQLATSYYDQTIEDLLALWERYEGSGGEPGLRYELDYEIDGLVVRSDSIALQRELGSRQNRPRFAMAYKFPSAGKATTLRAVDWSLGIGSRVTPIARLEPVPIAGVTVSNATLHNVDAIDALGLSIGDRVWVERRGDVIPQVMRVVEKGDGEAITPPSECPVCEAELTRDGKFLRCPSADCVGKTFGDVMRWIVELEIDSLGEKWVRILIEEGLVADPVDLYALTADKLTPLERMGTTLAEKLVRNIDATRSPSLDRFVAGLNITAFSRQRMQMLADGGVRNLDALLAMSRDEIAAIKGFGEILAGAIVEGLEAKRPLIDRLLEAGIAPQEVPAPAAGAAPADGPVAGKSFCFTGAIQKVDEASGKRYTRKQMQDLVTTRGGRAAKSVSDGLDYLVMANPDSTSSKAKKARQLGTEILSEGEFFALLEE